jgi:hypothetical protein
MQGKWRHRGNITRIAPVAQCRSPKLAGEMRVCEARGGRVRARPCVALLRDLQTGSITVSGLPKGASESDILF